MNTSAYADGRDTDAAVAALTDLTAILERRLTERGQPPPVTLHISHVLRLHEASGKAETMMVDLARRGPAAGVHVQLHPTAWPAEAVR